MLCEITFGDFGAWYILSNGGSSPSVIGIGSECDDGTLE